MQSRENTGKTNKYGGPVIFKKIKSNMPIQKSNLLAMQNKAKKYSHTEVLNQNAKKFAESCRKTCGFSVIVIGKGMIVAESIPKNELSGQKISADIDNLIDLRQPYVWRSSEKKFPVTDNHKYFTNVVIPIFYEGDVIGAVATIDTANLVEPSDFEIKLTKTAALFLEKQLEI